MCCRLAGEAFPLAAHSWLLAEGIGIDGELRAHPVEPEGSARSSATGPDSGFVGCNVTVPHKEAAFTAAARPDGCGRDGAANTVWLDDRTLCRHQHRSLRLHRQSGDQAPGWDANGRPGVVLGARRRSARHCRACLSRASHRPYRQPDAANAPGLIAAWFGAACTSVSSGRPPGLLPSAADSLSTRRRSVCTARRFARHRFCRDFGSGWSTTSSICRWNPAGYDGARRRPSRG